MLDGISGAFIKAFVLSFLAAVPATPVFCYLRKVFYVPFVRNKLLDKAIEKGHVVHAKLEKSSQRIGRGEIAIPINQWTVVYKYEYNGKVYKHRAVSTGSPPDEVTLYFEKKPSRACTYRELGVRESNWFRYYWWMVIVCFLLVLFSEVSKYAG